jgi:hypothetical protein
MMSAADSTHDPSVGEECLQADLDTSVGEDSRRLDPEAVVAMWEVYRLWEILPTASRVSGSPEKPITLKRLSYV